MGTHTVFNPVQFHKNLGLFFQELGSNHFNGNASICDKFINLFRAYRTFAYQQDTGRQKIYDKTLDFAIAEIQEMRPDVAKAMQQAELHIKVETPSDDFDHHHKFAKALEESLIHGGYTHLESTKHVSWAMDLETPSNSSLEELLGMFLKDIRKLIDDLQRQGGKLLTEEAVKLRIKQISTEKLCQSLGESREDPPYDLIVQLTDLNQCTSLDALKNIENSIVEHPFIKQKILEDLRSAFLPLMRYLANLSDSHFLETLKDLEHLRNVLRRWGFVEANNHIGGQEDMLECLQKLYDFLKDSTANIPKIKCEVFLSSNPQDWSFADLDEEDYFMLGEKFIKYEGNGLTGTLDRERVILLGKEYARTLISKGSLKDVLATTEEVADPHQQEKEFSPFLHIVPDGASLFPTQDLEKILSQSFDTDSHRIFYTINFEGQKIQKVKVPVVNRQITFNGHPPPGLFVSRQVGSYALGAFNMPPIAIPAIIHLQERNYQLKMAAAKSGDARSGHYVAFLGYTAEQGCYTNSLEMTPLRPTELPLHETVSRLPDICVCSYQLENSSVPFRPIQRKLYQQGDDNLCYLILAVQAIYGNPLFKSITAFEEVAASSRDFIPDTPMGALYKIPDVTNDGVPNIFIHPLDEDSQQLLYTVTDIVLTITNPLQEEDFDSLFAEKLRLLSDLLIENVAPTPFMQLVDRYRTSRNPALFKGISDNYTALMSIFRLMYQEIDTLSSKLKESQVIATASKKRDHASAFEDGQIPSVQIQIDALFNALLTTLQQAFEHVLDTVETESKSTQLTDALLNQYGLAWLGLHALSSDLYPPETAIQAFKELGADFAQWQTKHFSAGTATN